MACILGSKRSKKKSKDTEIEEPEKEEETQEEEHEVGHVEVNNGVTTIKGGNLKVSLIVYYYFNKLRQKLNKQQ